ncbi:sensory rhodopsin transducer [Microbacterium oxydans]|uniref:sensory rhodopsin transducer n=1 Tax=Microbacterium TaxID=33882 RepID=UPI001D106207|nr:sensory rhodopsin transducer [Microbacterium sp. R1]MCB8044074.1 hypothetical protein [Microbacterium oxydans]
MIDLGSLDARLRQRGYRGDRRRTRLVEDHCLVLVSDEPIIVQHTRLDSRQAENAPMSTIAYPASH